MGKTILQWVLVATIGVAAIFGGYRLQVATIDHALTQFSKENQQNHPVGIAVPSQENLGYSVSTTLSSVTTSTVLQVSPARTTRYYGALYNNSSATVYLYLGPTSTAVSGTGIPLVANTNYEISQGKGNLYFGAVSIPTSSVTGSIEWVEKFKL